jgi:chemotaxis signal transduction protein
MTQLPQAPDWFLGLLKYRDTNVRVVDSLKLLGIKKGSALDTPRHILVLAQGQWAISCDQLGEVISLQAGDIQWYGTVNKSLMLGTIKQSLAQLLDPDQIVKYLNQFESG